MSTNRPLLWRNAVLAAAIETTTGTAATIGASQSGFLVEEPRLQGESNTTDRPFPGNQSTFQAAVNEQSGKLSFKTHLYGSGTSGTDGNLFAVLLACCGYTGASHVYSPTSNPINTATIGVYEDGWLKKLLGAMGRVKLTAKAGSPAMLEWEFIGAWAAPTAVAIPTGISFPSVVPPRFAGASLTIASATYNISQVEIDLGQKTVLRRSATASGGIYAATITSRRVGLKVDPEAPVQGTEDFYAAYAAETTFALSMQIGAGSSNGNTIVVASPALQLSKEPQTGDREGMIINPLEFVALGSSGDDEITFTLS